MRISLNLIIISMLMIITLSYQCAYASDITSSVAAIDIDSNKIIELKDGTKVREIINNQQRSLYQIALLSHISVDELRNMNAGRYDKKDKVEIGERLVLPLNSPLLPAMKNADSNVSDKYANLPKLGSDDSYDIKQEKDPLATQIATALQTITSVNWKEITSSKNGGIAGHLKNKGKDYAENYVRNGVKTQLVDPLRNATQDFLGLFGTAQLQFDISDKGEFNNLNFKLFSPWYDSDNTLIFSQLSFQEYEHNRKIGNFGLGQRWDVADKKWLLGYNVFLDHDFQRAHNRLGVGAEAWTDYMKLAVNYYHPLSKWKDSRDFDDYLERPAKGYDIRFQGYLPQYPQLGGSLKYEQYFGDKVALFGKDNLQKNPKAATVGVDYTPVPLFTIKAEHKIGQSNKKMTNASLTMNYRIGTPLKDQLDPDMVQAARTLKGSRYDLVDRNNYIVLEYKEKKLSVDLGLERLQLIEGNAYGVNVAVHNAKGLSKVEWIGDMLEIDAGGGFFCHATSICTSSNWSVPQADANNWMIVAPNYVDQNGERLPLNTNGKYTLSVKVVDTKGRSAISNSVTFEVLPDLALRKLSAYAIDNGGTKTTSPTQTADGSHGLTLLASLVQLKTPNGSIDSDNDINGFSDEALMNSLPATFKTVQQNWKVTSNGTKIALVDGTSGAVTSCPSADPCVIIKAIEKVKNGQQVPSNFATAAGTVVVGDTYTLDVASNVEGVVDFAMSVDQLGESNKVKVAFTGGQASVIKIYKGDVLVASEQGNALVFDANGPKEWKTDNEYRVKAFASDGVTEINNPFIIWSLVGSNETACPPSHATQLPDANANPSGPWFNVAMGVNAHYKIRNNTNSYATSRTSISPIGGAPTSLFDLNPINLPQSACAGDQGFKLQVVVNN